MPVHKAAFAVGGSKVSMRMLQPEDVGQPVCSQQLWLFDLITLQQLSIL
jgi:hypothetical protein